MDVLVASSRYVYVIYITVLMFAFSPGKPYNDPLIVNIPFVVVLHLMILSLPILSRKYY